ncbi:putative bZIP transcription factor [Rosellinia necatrix]|uniref:Putative bZIP transcription factor n=1 Tax=Rosellinia necatrix TaxID=77044 RepID=A0A1W2TR64_ROSNE|nr:putative bZIP transcription factor [Rosellinia necatrix]
MASLSALPNASSSMVTRPHPTKLAISPPAAAYSPTSEASPLSSVSTPSLSTPQLAIKPASAGSQALCSAGLPPKTSITSKEWVIPPRPKPGRKPATDTPPTKRKAQNRAAQRAFRERRAARVGELEEELEEQREAHERIQQQLHNQIEDLNTTIESLTSEHETLKDTLEKERTERLAITDELESLRRRLRDEASSIPSRNGSFMSQHGQVQSFSLQHQISSGGLTSNAPGHRHSTSAFSIPQMISPRESSASSSNPQAVPDAAGCGNCSSTGTCACIEDALAGATVGCGKCSLGTRCECLEAVLNGPATTAEAELKRKHSSISTLAPEEKRQKAETYPNEIDFTAMFSKKKVSIAAPAPMEPLAPSQSTLPPRESCGFCTESSYCMCAEAAAAQTLPPMSQQVQTPPPSEDDVGPPPIEVTSTGAIKLPSLSSLNRNSFQSARKPSGCGPKAPGTCSQCLSDPKSGLFCRSLAAAFARESRSQSGGCCGGASAGSGCCRSTDSPSQSFKPTLGVSLSCADAYQTLSSHPGFEKATDELETWLPKLRAVPKPANGLGRTALDVETASIMGVLKEFDVRFGRNK